MSVDLVIEGVSVKVSSDRLNLKKAVGRDLVHGVCVCGEGVDITADDIKGAGGGSGEHPRYSLFMMSKRYREFVEDGKKLAETKDFVSYLKAFTSWASLSPSEIEPTKNASTSIRKTCPVCQREHIVKLELSVDGELPQLPRGVVDVYRERGFDLKDRDTRTFLSRAAVRARLGTAEGYAEHVKAIHDRLNGAVNVLDGVDDAYRKIKLKADLLSMFQLSEAIEAAKKRVIEELEWQLRVVLWEVGKQVWNALPWMSGAGAEPPQWMSPVPPRPAIVTGPMEPPASAEGREEDLYARYRKLV